MRIRLYNDITARLARVRIVDGIPAYIKTDEAAKASKTRDTQAIKHFDLWNENIVHLTQQRPFQTPAVFVEFLPIVWRQIGKRCKKADVSIRLHIVTSSLATVNTPYKDVALLPLYLIQAIEAAMCKFAGAADEHGLSYSSFAHMESTTDHNHEQISEHIETWHTMCYDCTEAIHDGLDKTPHDVTLDLGDIFYPEFDDEFT